MTLGEYIKNYIDEHDLSLRAFARLTGLSVTYISYLIKGETQRGIAPVPSIDTYKVCAKAMGLETDELVRLVDDEIAWGNAKNPVTIKGNGFSEKLDKAMKLLESLPDYQQDMIIAQLEGLTQHQSNQGVQ